MENEPVFPPELERELFETTALMHRGTIPALLRVARRVLIWIEPFLYTVVRLNHQNRFMVRALLDAMDLKPLEFFSKAVRHLAFEDSECSVDEARRLLGLCTGVVNFISNYMFTAPTLLPIFAEMRIRRLFITPGDLFGTKPIDLAHPLFRSVTHLDMFATKGVVQVLPDLPQLPALTHLCLDCLIPRQISLAVLANCSRLQLLLVQWQWDDRESYELERTPHVYDVRFVIGMYVDYWGEWEAGAWGLPDLWTQGDAFVARKRNREIEATCFWLS